MHDAHPFAAWRPFFFACLAFLAGLAVTGIVALAQQRADRENARLAFVRQVDRLEAEVNRRVRRAEFGLKGTRAAFAAAGQWDRESFRRFVVARDLPNELPGVRGFGLIERVPGADLASFVERARLDDAPAFSVHPPQPDAAEHLVIKYVEPMEANRAALGFDIASDPARRLAALAAIDTGQPTLTSRITLLQDPRRGPGWLMFLPLYAEGGQPPTLAERERQLVGLLFAPVSIADLLAGIGEVTEGQVQLQLYDGEPAAASLLFDPARAADERSDPADEFDGRMFSADREMIVGARVLTLRVASSEGADAAYSEAAAMGIALAGVALSLLLGLAMWLALSGRERAERLAHAMTLDLDRMAKVVERSHNAVVGFGLDRRITWINEGFTRTTGYTEAEAVGRTLPELLRHPQGAPSERDTLATAIAAGEPCRVELLNRRKDGSDCWMDIELQPVRDPQGRLTGFIELALDVTERNKAREAALSASAAKSLFLSTMSHEIRTPMNAIFGLLKLLGETGLNARQRDYATKAEGAARSLLSLLNDILDLSKIEAQKMELDPRPFEVEGLLRDVSAVLSASVASKNVELVFDLDAEVPAELVGDDMRLRQILLNLGGNAVKFTQAGEVVVRIALADRTAGQARVQFSVADTGIGIAPENQGLLFGDFSQATVSTARQFGGTGLGLSICRKLVALMGGELRLQSELGRGSVFSFTLDLPLLAQAPAQAQPTAALLAAPAAHRLLVVEANVRARAVHARMARALGWEVDLAEGLDTAAAQVEAARRYDAVLLDYRLLGSDPQAGAARLCDAAGRRPRLIFTGPASGRDLMERSGRFESACIEGFVAKPLLPSALAAALNPPAAPAPGTAAVERARPLAGMRLLLVEDNPINQIVATELLGACGALMELAADGAQAVAKLEAGAQFDAVLMDVHMPVLDGYQATEAIRHRLGLATLPIVAMTANAMSDERRKCLQAGMNDHIAKPFEVERVVATLLRLVPDFQPHAPAAPAAEVPAVSEDAPARPAVVPRGEPAADPPATWDRDKAMGYMAHSEKLAAKLIPMFHDYLVDIDGRVPEVVGELQGDDRVRFLHTLKGKAATMGADRLSQASARAEAQAQQGGACDAAVLAEVGEAVSATLAAMEGEPTLAGR